MHVPPISLQKQVATVKQFLKTHTYRYAPTEAQTWTEPPVSALAIGVNNFFLILSRFVFQGHRFFFSFPHQFTVIPVANSDARDLTCPTLYPLIASIVCSLVQEKACVYVYPFLYVEHEERICRAKQRFERVGSFFPALCIMNCAMRTVYWALCTGYLRTGALVHCE